MAITSSYLVAVGKLSGLLEVVRNAQAPERFTIHFLQELGYKSTNDRLYIGVLKALGFLDQNGAPQQRYYDYLDEAQSEQVLAEGVQDAYEDLFRVNKNAHKMTQQQVKSKLKSLTQGEYSDNVLSNMSRTFVELVKFADFELPRAKRPEEEAPPSDDVPSEEELPEMPTHPSPKTILPMTRRLIDSVGYRIEVVLPPTRDKAVYDAIFRSLKEHLL